LTLEIGDCASGEVDLGCGCGELAPTCGTCDGSIIDLGCGCGEPEAGECGCDLSVIDLGCGCGEPGPDECGTCDGSIIDLGCGCGEPEAGECGCDITVVDLGCGCGESGPDECGTCDGSIIDLGCGCGELGPTGCDNTCGSSLQFDECGECGGDGIADGECDCDGNVIDICGVCGGGEENPSNCLQNFVVNINPTGLNQLVIVQNSVLGLEPGDEIGIFDSNGVLETSEFGESISYGEVLVGSSIWFGEQQTIRCILSVDQSSNGGPTLSGAVSGNPLIIKIWKQALNQEFIPEITFTNNSNGEFGELFTVVSGLYVEGFGCNDLTACNYDENATYNDGSCWFPEEGCNCSDGQDAISDCMNVCNGTAILDACSVCSGGTSGHIENSDIDCNGICFGSADIDACGICSGGDTGLLPNILENDFISGPDADCLGICFGDATLDCLGDCSGSAVIDCAGVCSGGNICGCTDELAFNFDPYATYDDDTCFFGCPDGWEQDCNGVCQDLTLLGNDVCDNGENGGANFACEQFYFDNSDCPIGELYFGDIDQDNQTISVYLDCAYDVSNFQFSISGLSGMSTSGGMLDIPVYLPPGISNDTFTWQQFQAPLTANFGLIFYVNYQSFTGTLDDICLGSSPTITTSDGIVYQAAVGGCASSLSDDGGDDTDNELNNDNITIVSDFILEKAYPNPFNPAINIPFSLSRVSQVSINIYDINGIKIAEVVNGLYSAGYNNIVWNAEGFSSGNYFIVARFEKEVYKQKVILLK